MLDAGGIVHMAENLVGEGRLKFLTALFEEFELTGREGIEVVAVGTYEMAEHRTGDDGVLMLQTVDYLVDIVDGVEAKTVHARVEFDVNRPACDTLLTGCLDEGIHQTEGVDFGFQIIVEHGLKGRHLGVHNHDIGGDASLAKGDTLVGHGHGKIVHTVVLQRLGNLHGPSPVGISLDHADHLRLGPEEGAEVVQVLNHGVEVDLEDGLMNLLLQLLGDPVKTERTGTLQENKFVVQVVEGVRGQEMVHIGKELFVGDMDPVCLGREFRANADKLVDAPLHAEVRDLGVEDFGGGACLENIA